MTDENKMELDKDLEGASPALKGYIDDLRKTARDSKKAAEELKVENARLRVRNSSAGEYRGIKDETLRGLRKKRFGAPNGDPNEVLRDKDIRNMPKSDYRATKQAFLHGLRQGERK